MKERDCTYLGLKPSQATDPQDLTRPALDRVVGGGGVVGVAREGVLVHVGRVQSLWRTGANPELGRS